MASRSHHRKSPDLSQSDSPQRPYQKPSKKHDPFDDIPCPSDPRDHPNNDGSDRDAAAAAAADSDSTFTKLVSAPLFFLSFLLSLAFIDRQNRFYRVAQHPPQPPRSFWARFTAPLSNWWDPEPYQDPDKGTWQHRERPSSGEGSGVLAGVKKKERWYATKNHRKLASMEVAKAFEITGRMKAVVAGVFGVGTLFVGWGIKMIYERLYW